MDPLFVATQSGMRGSEAPPTVGFWRSWGNCKNRQYGSRNLRDSAREGVFSAVVLAPAHGDVFAVDRP